MDTKLFSDNLSQIAKTELRELALFDFDGTLTSKDTFIEFLKFFKGPVKFYCGMVILSPIIILYKLRMIKNWRAKEIMMNYFLAGVTILNFQESCNRFSATRINNLIRAEALKKLIFHRSRGDEVFIVSASPENWIRVYGESISVKVIATQLEVKNEKITGKIAGKNCYGPEKAQRIQASINLKDFSTISAYGDSRGDKEMLELAKHQYYRRFY
jgi:HAD superfamily hydrolase (TIGR01490 family)